ncbi:MAG: hypothetical protein IPP46_20100 [Bacteroidetes bacterium]|nr:hypothetical protein [Bacteroidota bacterium]
MNLEFPFTEGDAIITVVNSLGQTLLKQNVQQVLMRIFRSTCKKNLPEGLYFYYCTKWGARFYSFHKKVSVFN